MKTKMFIVGVVALLMAMPATAQEYQRWSINVNGGLSSFLPSDGRFFKDLGPSFGLSLEWTANPLWGISLDYQYVSYYNKKKHGHTNDLAISGRFNVSNVLAKFRSGHWQKLNSYLHVGAGASIARTPRGTNLIGGVVPAGAMLEYNITPLLALNMDIGVCVHNNRFREVRKKLVYPTATVGIRVKLGAGNHIRNVSLPDYEAAFTSSSGVSDEAIKQLQRQLKDTDAEAAKNKNAVEEAKRQIDALRREVESLKAMKETAAATANTTAPAAGLFSRTVTFDFAKAELKPSFYPFLDEVAAELVKTDARVAVIGHTDIIGDAATNMRLSVRRANVVANYLTKKGVPAKQVTTKGMGFTQPIADNKTEEGRQKNRRVEFVVQ